MYYFFPNSQVIQFVKKIENNIRFILEINI